MQGFVLLPLAPFVANAQGGRVVPQNLALPQPQKHPKKPRRKWPGCFCRYHNASAFH